jgi:hypothetical protein
MTRLFALETGFFVYMVAYNSITQGAWDPESGWGTSLQHVYQRRLDVVGRGFGGTIQF